MSSDELDSVDSGEEIDEDLDEEEEDVVVEEVEDDEEDSEEDEKPTKRAKGSGGKKNAKDPNKPKRNQSAYMIYSNANRARIKEENPDITFGQIAQVISKEFKGLSPEERKQWDVAAAKDKKRYQEEMKCYEPQDGSGSNKRKKKQDKDPNKPKRNMTAYFLYSNANRERIKAENPEAKFGDIAKIIASEYKLLSAKDKSALEKKAQQDKVRYQKEMEVYNANK